MEFVLPILASAAVGFAVGMLSGLLGIGGGTILVPVFKLGFGMSPLQCTATSLFTIIPTSLSGFIEHVRNKTCIPRLGVAAGVGGAVTSPVGVWLASVSPEWGTMVAAAVVIAYSASTMLRKALAMKAPAKRLAAPDAAADAAPSAAVPDADVGADAAPVAPADQPASAAASGDTASVVQRIKRAGFRPVAICAAIGLVAGLLSGYVGVGGGFIMVPLMMQILNMPMKLTSGTSLIAIMILAVPGVVAQALLGNVDWLAGVFVACGSIPGAVVGSRLMTRAPERGLRFLFSGFLFVAATVLVLDQFSVL